MNPRESLPDINFLASVLDDYDSRENVGLIRSTRIGSRRVIQISAGFMIFFSILGDILEIN